MEGFETEKEAIDFLKENGIEVLIGTIENLKRNGHIKKTLIEEIEITYNEYKKRHIKSNSTISDLKDYIGQDHQIIQRLYEVIRCLYDESKQLKEKLAEKEA